MSSAICLNLDQCQILSYGKELIYLQKISESVNSITHDNILDWIKFIAYADNKFDVANLILSVFVKIENIVGKGENDGHQYFLLFPQCFQKHSLFLIIKSRYCLLKS